MGLATKKRCFRKSAAFQRDAAAAAVVGGAGDGVGCVPETGQPAAVFHGR